MRNYKEHIDRLHAERMTGTLSEINETITSSMRLPAFNQCSGSELPSPEEKLQNFCGLINPTGTDESKTLLVQNMLTDQDYLKNIPLLMEAMDKGLVKSSIVQNAISQNIFLKNRVLGLIEQLKESPLIINYASFAKKMGWLSSEKEKEYITTFIKEELKLPGTLEKTDRLCHLPLDVKSQITLADLEPMNQRLSSVYGAKLMNCLNLPLDETYLNKVSNSLLSSNNYDHQKELIWSMQKIVQNKMLGPNEVLLTGPINRTQDQKEINERIIKIVKDRHDLSTVIYSFSPGENLSSVEKKFIKDMILKGPQYFPGWQFTWLLRVATRSSLKDPAILESLGQFEYHERAKQAVREYRGMYK
jgi:hypothetical protein